MPALLLMRHAKSDWSDSSLSDHERPLNKRGQKAAPAMARHLRLQQLIPSRLISSSAARAVATAQAIRDEFELPAIEIEPSLYLANLTTWIEFLKRLELDETTLIVGHNPGLEDILFEIAQTPSRFPTAAIACLHSRNDQQLTLSDLELKAIWRPKEISESR